MLHALTAAGLLVLVPFGRFGPYDLVAETAPGDFVRIQVKSGRMRGGCVEFNCRGTDHGAGSGCYAGRADVFAVHVHGTGEQFIVPVAQARASKRCTCAPCRRPTARCVAFASQTSTG